MFIPVLNFSELRKKRDQARTIQTLFYFILFYGCIYFFQSFIFGLMSFLLYLICTKTSCWLTGQAGLLPAFPRMPCWCFQMSRCRNWLFLLVSRFHSEFWRLSALTQTQQFVFYLQFHQSSFVFTAFCETAVWLFFFFLPARSEREGWRRRRTRKRRRWGSIQQKEENTSQPFLDSRREFWLKVENSELCFLFSPDEPSWSRFLCWCGWKSAFSDSLGVKRRRSCSLNQR